MGFLANEYLLVGDVCKMSGQEKKNSKELEGEVIEKVQDIETIGDLKRDKAAKKTYVTKARSCRDMNTEQKPLEYEFNHLVFGVNSSLFLAQFVSRHHAKLHEKQYPRAAESMLKSTYMDNSMDSAIDETERY